MLNKIDCVYKYNKKKLESVLNTKINDDLLSNKEFKKYIKSISKNLDSINPESLKQIYKDTSISIHRIFKSRNSKLEINKDTIEFNDNKIIGYSRYSKFKSNIISKIEDEVDKKYKIKEKTKLLNKEEIDYKDKRYDYFEKVESIDEYINRLNLMIDPDLEMITNVDNIKVGKNKLGLIERIIVTRDKKDYILKPDECFKNDEFNGKYPRLLEIIDGNYVVNIVENSDAPKVDYYAHTSIDSVYGLEGKWGLVDINDNVIIEPIYVYPFIEQGNNLQVMLPETIEDGVIKTLRHGLIDTKGNVIIPIKYIYMEEMDNSGTYFRVVDPKTYKSGVLDKFNNIVVPFIYDYICASPDLELCEKTKYSSIYPDYIYQVKVCKKDLYGVYDLKLKKEIIKPKYKELRIIGYNKFLVGEDYESCNTLINEKCKKVKGGIYDN